MLSISNIELFKQPLNSIKVGKLLITTINAHSFNVAQKDSAFAEALQKSNILLPDGISITFAKRWLMGEKIMKIAGSDLFYHEMKWLQQFGGRCFFLGSTEATLNKISAKAKNEFPSVKIKTYSPPFKAEFTKVENQAMITAINSFEPDVLFIGMTAPKQEKWAAAHFENLKVGHVCCIGAVFDFYAGTVNRAPNWMIRIGMEWFYRLVKEPRRMWYRYLVGNTKFVWAVIMEKLRR